MMMENSVSIGEGKKWKKKAQQEKNNVKERWYERETKRTDNIFFFLYKNATKKGEKDVLYKPVFLITLVQPLQGNFFSLSSS